MQKDMNHLLYKVIDNTSKPKIQVDIRGEKKTFTPEEITAMMLHRMKETAEAYLGLGIAAVITVPVTYNSCQRQAIRDAASIAGLRVLRIIPSPAAAALAFEMDKNFDSERHLMVIDLGGGMLDICIITVSFDILEVQAYCGDMHLGGEDFDNRLVYHFVKEFRRKHKKDISQHARAMIRLQIACEKAKYELSASSTATIQLDSLFEGIDFHTSITRNCFEELCADLFRGILEPIENTLRYAKLDKYQIQDVVLVGGSTRIPKIQKILKEFFKETELRLAINPDEAVASGAAIQAARLNYKTDDRNLLLLNATTMSLGIEGPGGEMHGRIKRNTNIPILEKQRYATTEDNVTDVCIQVYEGERAMTKDNHLLGVLELSGIPSLPRGKAEIDLTFDIDTEGTLDILAEIKGSGMSEKVPFKNSSDYLSRRS